MRLSFLSLLFSSSIFSVCLKCFELYSKCVIRLVCLIFFNCLSSSQVVDLLIKKKAPALLFLNSVILVMVAGTMDLIQLYFTSHPDLKHLKNITE